MAYCANYDVVWQDNLQRLEQYRKEACFSQARREFGRAHEVVLYILTNYQYESKNRYDDRALYSEKSELRFTIEEVQRYCTLLNKIGMKCEFLGETPVVPDLGFDSGALVISVKAAEMPCWVTFATLTVLRYLYEYYDGHDAIARAFLDFDKDRTYLTSVWNKLAIAHFCVEDGRYHSGHCMRQYNLFKLMSDEECRKWLQTSKGKNISPNLQNGPETVYNQKTGKSQPDSTITELRNTNGTLAQIAAAYKDVYYESDNEDEACVA